MNKTLLEKLNLLGLARGRKTSFAARRQASAADQALEKGLPEEEIESFLRAWVPSRPHAEERTIMLGKKHWSQLERLAKKRVTNIEHLFIQWASGKVSMEATPRKFVDPQVQVEEFHKEIGQPNRTKYKRLTEDRWAVRARLIAEEAAELAEAFTFSGQNRVLCVLKESMDLIYVILGTFVELGLDHRPFFQEVHESNMSKVDGHLENGKWIKPDNYKKADMLKVLKDVT